MKINTEGLVILEQTIGESDKLITILTKKEGLIRAFVRSAKNIKNKNSIATQMLCYSDFIIYKGRDKYIVNEAEVKELFFYLRNDIKKISLAQYFCEIALVLAPCKEDCIELLRLILNSLFYLQKENSSSQFLKSIVEIRAISTAGFMPNLICCKRCETYQSEYMYLNFSSGNILCYDCLKKEPKNTVIVLDRGAIAAFRHIIYSDFEKIFSFKIREKSQEILSTASEKYFRFHTNHNYKTLDFYNSLLIN